MNILLVAPVLVPLATLLLGILLRVRIRLVEKLSIGGCSLLLVGLTLVWQAASDVVLSGQLGAGRRPTASAW